MDCYHFSTVAMKSILSKLPSWPKVDFSKSEEFLHFHEENTCTMSEGNVLLPCLYNTSIGIAGALSVLQPLTEPT